MSNVFEAGASRAALDGLIHDAPAHLNYILVAVRDFQMAFMFVPQGPQVFRIPKRADRPTVILIGDDLDEARGPKGFHTSSLRRIIRSCDFFTVVASAPSPILYDTMATMTASTRKNGLLIETRPEQEIQWVSLIQKHAPGRQICLSTVKGAMQ